MADYGCMRRRLVALFILTGVFLLATTPAFAHVTVNPSSAAKGSFAKLTFRVPNESDTASTTALEVNFPTNAALEFVSVKPVPGWSAATTKSGKVVSKITWTGGKIAPGEFQEFDVSVGPIPDDVDELVFKAIQTYSDGEVSRWIDATPASGEEPEHPAPVLKLTAATDDHHDDAAEVTETTAVGSEPDDDAASDGPTFGSVVSDADQARTLAIVGIVLALIAGAIAVSARRVKGGRAD